MESKAAIDRLSALAQPARLDVFRLLVRAGPDGIAAGEIAAELGQAPNTLSAQLNVLSAAGLILGTREGRSIRYTAQPEALSELIVYLMEDCCGGRPEICAPVEAAARAACCPPAKSRAGKPVRA
ncbi:MAG: metalloregulator ArsR/SmtB family transcription factor [Hyphomonas sp.]|jgi:DNA-binding transcriptional ArsR family regulator|nr:metalloregulator ArsR/SmtB family transcription factor [Hyphomonas sp.]